MTHPSREIFWLFVLTNRENKILFGLQGFYITPMNMSQEACVSYHHRFTFKGLMVWDFKILKACAKALCYFFTGVTNHIQYFSVSVTKCLIVEQTNCFLIALIWRYFWPKQVQYFHWIVEQKFISRYQIAQEL